MTKPSASDIIRLLDLKPLPQEGGYYRETYRASLRTPESALPECYTGDRNASTAIYFLLTPEEPSLLHVLPTDELFHFYLGDPVEMLRLAPENEAEVLLLGDDLLAGERPQAIVLGGVWQGCRLVDGGEYALLGCTVSPGFDFRDFHVATPDETATLARQHAKHASLIRQLATTE